MPSFPLMSELPSSLSTRGWSWERICTSSQSSKDFWLASDRQGNKWLLKLRGSFCAYREITFARIAQKLGWSCQSSIYVHLDSEAAQVLGRESEEVHAAHWFMDEHAHSPCDYACPFEELAGRPIETIEDIRGVNIQHIIDWPKSELAAYVFGGNEPPGRFITIDHEFVIIDSEQMFSTDPSQFGRAPWMWRNDGSYMQSGHELALTVCEEVASLSENFVRELIFVPDDVEIEFRWPIMPKLMRSIEFARGYVRERRT